MRVAICDDDASMRDLYAEYIKLIADKHGMSIVVDRYESGKQLMFVLPDKEIIHDIVFLDIFMPGVDGIDLGTQLRKAGFVGSIVYLTRSKDHMLSAFDVGATNYVLKEDTFDSKRFERVFLKVAKEAEQKRRKYILFNGIIEHRNIAIDTIRCVEVRKHICVVDHGEDELFELVSSLGKIETTLLPFQFIRVHKSFLINGAKVKSFTAKQVVLDNDKVVPIGRKYAAEFREKMEGIAEMDVTE